MLLQGLLPGPRGRSHYWFFHPGPYPDRRTVPQHPHGSTDSLGLLMVCLSPVGKGPSEGEGGGVRERYAPSPQCTSVSRDPVPSPETTPRGSGTDIHPPVHRRGVGHTILEHRTGPHRQRQSEEHKGTDRQNVGIGRQKKRQGNRKTKTDTGSSQRR